MKFEDVIKALKAGKKIKRKDWIGYEYLGISFNYETEKTIRIVEMLCDDWEIVEDKPKKIDWREDKLSSIEKLRDSFKQPKVSFIDFYKAINKINEIIDYINKEG